MAFDYENVLNILDPILGCVTHESNRIPVKVEYFINVMEANHWCARAWFEDGTTRDFELVYDPSDEGVFHRDVKFDPWPPTYPS